MAGCLTVYVKKDALKKCLFCEMVFFQAIFLRSIILVHPVVILIWIKKVAVRDLSANNKRLHFHDMFLRNGTRQNISRLFKLLEYILSVLKPNWGMMIFYCH